MIYLVSSSDGRTRICTDSIETANEHAARLRRDGQIVVILDPMTGKPIRVTQAGAEAQEQKRPNAPAIG